MDDNLLQLDAWYKRLVNAMNHTSGELGMEPIETFAVLREAFAAGRAYQSAADREAVESVYASLTEQHFPWQVLAGIDKSLAALSAAAKVQE